MINIKPGKKQTEWRLRHENGEYFPQAFPNRKEARWKIRLMFCPDVWEVVRVEIRPLPMKKRTAKAGRSGKIGTVRVVRYT